MSIKWMELYYIYKSKFANYVHLEVHLLYQKKGLQLGMSWLSILLSILGINNNIFYLSVNTCMAKLF